MEEFLTLTVLGLSTAAVFALAASGLVLTYTTTGIFNFAHGAIAMLGAFCYWQLHVDWGWPIPLALATVVLVIAPGLGVAIERGIMRGLVDAPETIRIIITVSLLVAILGVAQWIWPPQEVYRVPLLFRDQRLSLFDVNVTYHDLFTFVVAVVVAIGLRLLLYRTQVGLDMRASVDSRPLAMLHGARPNRAAATAWAVGCGLAAVAGVLVGPLSGQLSHTNLTLLIINAYAAAMIGRLRSLPMTFVGAVFLGLADSYAIGYFPDSNAYLISFRFVIPVVVLFIVLLVLPNPQLRTHSATTSREDIPRTARRTAAVTAASIIGVALVLASVLNDADALRASRIFGIALIALSLVPLTGFGGQVSLCQMSFAAIGALVMAHHGQGGDPLALLLAAGVCAVVGGLVALPALRLSGLYLALATAAFAVFLDRWVFLFQSFELGPWTIKFWEGGVVAVDPLDVPGLDTTDRQTQLVVMAVVVALAYLLVVAVRRSSYGQRLLAMKDSPAACATLGIDITRVKLSVFALSAAMAGVGGALYAGTLGSVSAQRFSFFESLPLLLLTVVGGIGTAAGPLFAGVLMGGFPIAIATWPFLANLNRVLPGMMGVALGRNPNGAVRDIAVRYAVLGEVPVALAGLVASLAAACLLAVTGAITGWGLVFGLVGALVFWPQMAEVVVARRTTTSAPRPLERAGIDRVLTPAEVRELDAALGLTSDPEEVVGVGMSALQVTDVSVKFGGRLALDSVDLTAEAGIVTGLIGPNGAGKTTLFNVICGLQPALQGRVHIDGRDVTKLAPFKRARRGLARTFQRLEPFGLLTVRENVRLAADAARRTQPDQVAADLLERLRITELADQRADRLPTGQARVVELARALATAPKVLLLDEPASGQDERETATFSAVLREVAADGVAVVLVEHDIHLVMEVCSQIHVLDLGRVLATGTPSEVQRDESVLAAYLGAAP